jgi:hypothetical protein
MGAAASLASGYTGCKTAGKLSVMKSMFAVQDVILADSLELPTGQQHMLLAGPWILWQQDVFDILVTVCNCSSTMPSRF